VTYHVERNDPVKGWLAVAQYYTPAIAYAHARMINGRVRAGCQ